MRDVTHVYRVDEADGGIAFGDGAYGVIPPTGRATRLAATSTGAGAAGNVPGVHRPERRLGRTRDRGRGRGPRPAPPDGARPRRASRSSAQLAHVRALVARPDDDRYLIVFPQEYGHYLWEVVVDAAEPLGGGPSA